MKLSRKNNPMDDYISRKEAYKYVPALMMVYSGLAAVPAADVVPVIHGRWEPGDRICPVCKQDKFKDLDADIWADWMPPYCPNCGAKMDR